MEQIERIEFRQIRNVAEIINVTFDFIRQNFRLFSRSLYFIALPPIMVSLTIVSYFLFALIDGLANKNEVGEMVVSFVFIMVLGGILVAVGMSLLVGVVHVFVHLYIEKGKDQFDINDIWQGTKGIFWMLFLTNIGLGVLYVLSIVIPFGNLGLMMGLTFGALYYPLRVYERRGILQSFIVSGKLIQGRWWATLGLQSLYGLMTWVLLGLLSVPFILLAVLDGAGIVQVEDLIEIGSWTMLLGTALMVLYMSAFFLVSAAPLLSLIFHYHSQREKKKFPALLEQVEMIGSITNV